MRGGQHDSRLNRSSGASHRPEAGVVMGETGVVSQERTMALMLCRVEGRHDLNLREDHPEIWPACSHRASSGIRGYSLSWTASDRYSIYTP